MATLIDTTLGPVEGIAHTGYLSFRGIPYAAPPVGSGRFALPEPHPGWTEPLQAKTYAAAAPQVESQLELLRDPSISEFSDDCLYLNITTPACDDDKRPVLFWIHGGAFTQGSGANGLYRSPDLAVMGNCVLVTINYRLGPLGFLRLDEATNGACPSGGNEGLHDQIAALRWVRDNIGSFGGDADNITLFGESAGGMSVAALLAVPSCRGLFRRAIVQSGGGDIAVPLERASAMGEQLLVRLKEMGHDPAQLASLDSNILAEASSQLRHPQIVDRPSVIGLAMVPVVDGDLLPEMPVEAVRAGKTKELDLMIGWTRDEWNLFSAFDADIWQMPELRMYKLMERLGGSADRARQLAEDYRHALERRSRPSHPGALFSQAMTDYAFRMPSLDLLDAQQAAGGRAFAYEFGWESPLADNILGSCHALELPLLFGSLEPRSIRAWVGEGETVQQLSRLMQRSWAGFAADGRLQLDGQECPQWDKASLQVTRLGADSGSGSLHDRQSLVTWGQLTEAA